MCQETILNSHRMIDEYQDAVNRIGAKANQNKAREEKFKTEQQKLRVNAAPVLHTMSRSSRRPGPTICAVDVDNN